MWLLVLVDRFTCWLLGYTIVADRPDNPVVIPPELLDTDDSGERAEIVVRKSRRGGR